MAGDCRLQRHSLARPPDAAQYRGCDRPLESRPLERSRAIGSKPMRHTALGHRQRQTSSSAFNSTATIPTTKTSLKTSCRAEASQLELDHVTEEDGADPLRTKVAPPDAAPPAPNRATSFSRPTSPAPIAASASTNPRHSCSASTAPAACASRATVFGEFFSFDADRLVPDNTGKSFVQGCIELVGTWKDLGRWKRHIYRGVAETMEAQARVARRRHAASKRRGSANSPKSNATFGSGAPATSTSRTPGGPAKQPKNTAARSMALIPELLEKYRIRARANRCRSAVPLAVHERHPLPRLLWRTG